MVNGTDRSEKVHIPDNVNEQKKEELTELQKMSSEERQTIMYDRSADINDRLEIMADGINNLIQIIDDVYLALSAMEKLLSLNSHMHNMNTNSQENKQ